MPIKSMVLLSLATAVLMEFAIHAKVHRGRKRGRMVCL